MTFLLDANVLLALAWPHHPFHERAVARFRERNFRWGTCLLTQAAFVRLSSNPAVIRTAKSPSEAGQMLESLMRDKQHIFLEPPGKRRSSLHDFLQRCQGHNQVNDAFLVWLAESCDATLLTFDKGVEHLATRVGLVEVMPEPFS